MINYLFLTLLTSFGAGDVPADMVVLFLDKQLKAVENTFHFDYYLRVMSRRYIYLAKI